MKARFLLAPLVIAIIATSAPMPASGQTVRPESLSYMTRLSILRDVDRFENPRYSRDGRWLAFEARSNNDGGQHIFVAAASGGQPIAITTGTHRDARPMWTAAGDRLVFASSLTGGVMTIAIDPATGRAAGPVKRVSIDSVVPRGFDVAPDGKSVAYLTPTAANRLDLRVVSINGGPSNTLGTVHNGADAVQFDRTGAHIYFVEPRLEGTPQKGYRARDVKRIAISGGPMTTVLTIPEGLMGVQINPVADRLVVRNGDRAHVLTLGGDSVATIAWASGMRTVSHLAFPPDGASIVTGLDARRESIHVVPVDGGPIRALTDSSGTPWPDYWLGDQIYLSGNGRRMVQDLVSSRGTKSTIALDLRKANDGVPPTIVEKEPFSDGVHFLVRTATVGGDTSLFLYNSRTGDARRVAQNVIASRMFSLSGPGDDYSGRVGDAILYRNIRNGIAEAHLLDVSGRDRVIHSIPVPKERSILAVATGRTAYAYQRADTLVLDVTLGSEKPVRVLTRPGATIGEMVFTVDGSSLFVEVITGTGKDARQHGAFFSTVDARALATPARWVETGICWHPTWLPNGAGVLEFCENATETKTWVWRVPATGPATPQVVTQRETAIFWDYTMSPDGKHIAVPAVSNSGMDLWRIDLRAAPQRQR